MEKEEEVGGDAVKFRASVVEEAEEDEGRRWALLVVVVASLLPVVVGGWVGEWWFGDGGKCEVKYTCVHVSS